ncbi:putative GTPases (G3E family) [Thermoplasmatales archaeon BRNA1]|nr:putative GTPases (G3E family) [Thermoplasmatales archaeon BRNA1]
MYVYILGGFLGSGKTSLLMRLASMFSEKKQKVAILVNESGEIGVDGATLKAQGYDAVELPSGCVCCTLAGTLQTALVNIVNDIDPDVVIIEPTGLALPHKVKDLVSSADVDEDRDIIIGIADIQRFNDLIKKKEEFFTRQMQGSDFILINKCDLAKDGEIEEATKWLNERFPDKEIIPVSVKEGTNLDKVYGMME